MSNIAGLAAIALLAHSASKIKTKPSDAYEIVKYPDPILLARMDEVTEFDDAFRLRTQRLLITVQCWPHCSGLAANQVNLRDRMFADRVMVYVNPVLLETSNKRTERTEMCMSTPNHSAKVMRHNYVKMRYQDVWGTEHVISSSDLRGRIWQHEIDHLNGITLPPPKGVPQ